MTAVAVEPDWVIEERVPVYDAHVLEITDPKTGKVVSSEPVTRERLETIAKARNARIKRTGNLNPIIVGHTRYDLPEYAKAKWAPTVGWADEYEVGEHETDGRPTLYARHRFYPESDVGGERLTADQIMRRFPHRSVEINLQTNTLDAVSLLAANNPPARELGLLRMAAAADPNVATVDPTPEPPVDKTQELIAALMQVLEQFAGGGEAPPAAAPGGPPPAQYAACGATNATEPELEKVRMQRDSENIRLKQIEDRLKAKDDEVAALKLQYQRERREKDLIQLEAEGYDLDRAEELDRLAPLPDANYAAELGRIKKHYQRMPVGSAIRTAPLRDTEQTPFTPSPDHERRKQWLMNNPGKSREDAIAALGAA